jgi:hypothetical protein
MKTIQNIRGYVGRRMLARKARLISRNKRIHNFTSAESAGIIFHCRNEEDFQFIKEFKKYLKENDIKASVLGFINDKQIPDHFLLRTGFNFFCLKNLSWSYKPESQFILDFINKRFDILFDFSLEHLFPIHYIVSLTNAEYKVGRLTKYGDYDLMIDIRKNRNTGYFIDQVKVYLNMIQHRN